MIRLVLTTFEIGLLESIEEIGFGELGPIAWKEAKDARTVELDSQAATFIKQGRRHGKFDKVVIHDREPYAAEIAGQTKQGISCTTKLRF